MLIAILIYLTQIPELQIFLLNASSFLRKTVIFAPSWHFSLLSKGCLTCPFVAPRISVTDTKSTLKITDHFDCTTSDIINYIQCSHCNHLYYEETCRHLGDRFRDHLHVIQNNDLSKPVSRHFNSFNHSFLILLHSVFVAFGISLINGGNDYPKNLRNASNACFG